VDRNEIIDQIFSEEGLLPLFLKEYEPRDGQREMALEILGAYLEEKAIVIEAGTGIGKSLAYLVPAIVWAVKHKEKTVVATHTIALQEQLLTKEIPFIKKMLDAELKVVLVKGMSNYLCLRKLQNAEEQLSAFSPEECKELTKLSHWGESTRKGSSAELPFTVSPQIWDSVKAESASCTHVKCPHYKKCFFFKARREANDADLLIVNHHLLLADLAAKVRNPDKAERSILPPFKRVVIDEAHHFEEIALESLCNRVDRNQLLYYLSEFHSEHKELTLVGRMKEKLKAMMHDPTGKKIIKHLETDLPLLKKEVHKLIADAFADLERFIGANNKGSTRGETRLRLKKEYFSHPIWKESLLPSFREAGQKLKAFTREIFSLSAQIEEIEDEDLSSIAAESEGLGMRLEEAAKTLLEFFEEQGKNTVQWIERSEANHAIVMGNLDISTYLNEHFFQDLSTLSFCSATLSTGKNFDFFKKRTGVDLLEKAVIEKIYESPFDYVSQSRFYIPIDISGPTEPRFISDAAELISRAIKASKGGAFVLFTSYEMLEQCYRLSKDALKRYNLLKQGALPRTTLIENFKSSEQSVLFATDSFWEGVDVAGDTLRLVILVKIPFKVPSDPLVEARCSLIESEGANSFMNYLLPEAVVKFKQGFGRLIRKKTDRGCILCLDHRIIKKTYGKLFVKSLPASPLHCKSSDEIIRDMENFYRE
jgi:ATP-dependent DNA helicase DinG